MSTSTPSPTTSTTSPSPKCDPDDGHIVTAIATAVVYNTSSGLCEYGKVCALCDCFADGDGGKYRDHVARAAARAALAVWQRDG